VKQTLRFSPIFDEEPLEPEDKLQDFLTHSNFLLSDEKSVEPEDYGEYADVQEEDRQLALNTPDVSLNHAKG
jgi:hypothetical protein